MTDFYPTDAVLGLYALLFAVAALRQRQFGWLALSLGLLLVGGGVWAWLLPEVGGVFSRWNMYALHGYIFVASLPFWRRNFDYLPQQAAWRWRHGGSWFLSLWAVASLVQHMAWLILVLLFWRAAPQAGWAALLRPLDLYVLPPCSWHMLQFLLMTVLWLHLKIKRAALFSMRMLGGAVAMTLLWQLSELTQLPWRIGYGLRYLWWLWSS